MYIFIELARFFLVICVLSHLSPGGLRADQEPHTLCLPRWSEISYVNNLKIGYNKQILHVWQLVMGTMDWDIACIASHICTNTKHQKGKVIGAWVAVISLSKFYVVNLWRQDGYKIHLNWDTNISTTFLYKLGSWKNWWEARSVYEYGIIWEIWRHMVCMCV